MLTTFLTLCGVLLLARGQVVGPHITPPARLEKRLTPIDDHIIGYFTTLGQTGSYSCVGGKYSTSGFYAACCPTTSNLPCTFYHGCGSGQLTCNEIFNYGYTLCQTMTVIESKGAGEKLDYVGCYMSSVVTDELTRTIDENGSATETRTPTTVSHTTAEPTTTEGWKPVSTGLGTGSRGDIMRQSTWNFAMGLVICAVGLFARFL